MLDEIRFIPNPLSNTATCQTNQTLRWQQGDLLLQTASWMLTSNLRWQPFGGLRYVQYVRKYPFRAIGPSIMAQFVIFECDIFSSTKLDALGAILGFDLKYIISKHFHFFSSLTGGIVAGHQTSRAVFVLKYITPPHVLGERTSKDRFALNWLPTFDLSFGGAWEHRIGKSLLLSLRCAYEIHMLGHQATPPLNTVSNVSTLAIQELYFLVQAGSFGITLAF